MQFACVYLYLYCPLGSNYQEEKIGIPLTGFTPFALFSCPRPGDKFTVSYFMVCFRGEVVIRFFYYGRIVEPSLF